MTGPFGDPKVQFTRTYWTCDSGECDCGTGTFEELTFSEICVSIMCEICVSIMCEICEIRVKYMCKYQATWVFLEL